MVMIDLRLGDCLDVVRILPDCSVNAMATDPPYGLAFNGRQASLFDLLGN